MHLSKEIQNKPISAIELCDLFLGKMIGIGASRTVYQCLINDTYVIKHENHNDMFQNVTEWRLWQEIKEYKEYSKWFAPCHYISPNGMFLIQSKVEKIPVSQYPKEIPAFFGDLKYQNFGMLNGHFVCFDYGTSLITKNWNKRSSLLCE